MFNQIRAAAASRIDAGGHRGERRSLPSMFN